MNADTKNNILSMALEARQLELEQARMQSEDHQSKLTRQMELEKEKTSQLLEEVSYIQIKLYNQLPRQRDIYNATCDALEILDPGNPANYD